MKKIYVATKGRGFLKNLFKSELKHHKFIYEENKFHEVNSTKKKMMAKIAKSRIADYLGLIQRIKVNDESCDIVFSYNRFLKSNKNYVIYLENPLALVHYSTKRNKALISKIKLNKYLNDTKLKAIICMSKACQETIRDFYEIPDNVEIKQIYPLAKANVLTSEESVKLSCREPVIQCLYISSDFNLKGGKDILEAFNKLWGLGKKNIKLNIITPINKLDKETFEKIEDNDNVNVFDFRFSKEELYEFYNTSCIVLNPSRQDSFPLVILEAVKSGNVVITTDIYGLPEMVEDNYNGYLTQPRYRFFNYNNLPNELVWNNRDNTIYSDYLDENIIEFLVDKLIFLDENRSELERMALNSLFKGENGEFNEEYILDKWSETFSYVGSE
ncbi:glycosyltransferase family 4 protein [Pontibacillus sp. ALD_SL1]|uniref:glycosyltransferase family 4 protein n=1 Tax=Pontibacillus sp. ALD_SL1 TaxID=2777185 RepID=UPI001A97B2D1|nr:glycosyltransferase family 4 protein [Pontibacillus sp. ALD_SL1]QSS99782.1 glycosyltransferase family 4 protein [Pontibacillus sp. ALD_SL1]